VAGVKQVAIAIDQCAATTVQVIEWQEWARMNKYPPAEPEVLRLLAPQRGLTAIGHSQNPNTGDGVLQYPGNVKLWESPRQSRGFSPINNLPVDGE
jgi:hypothetical protein